MKKINNRFGAIDLGSTNCRLIIVELFLDRYKVLNNYSEILNLGKNLSYSNEFTDETINKTVNIFKIISQKLKHHEVPKYRCIATEACRQSINTHKLIKNVYDQTRIKIDVISTQEEARLCLKSCLNYKINYEDFNLLFDIGGGSTEIILIDTLKKIEKFDFLSVQIGVVNFEEKIAINGKNFVLNQFRSQISELLKKINRKNNFNFAIGSCGTVTTLSAIHQDLKFYQKNLVDNSILDIKDVKKICNYVKGLSFKQKQKHPCIGLKRANLLESGIIILETILEKFSIEKILVSDKGLREGIIIDELKNLNEKNKT